MGRDGTEEESIDNGVTLRCLGHGCRAWRKANPPGKVTVAIGQVYFPQERKPPVKEIFIKNRRFLLFPSTWLLGCSIENKILQKSIISQIFGIQGHTVGTEV